MKQLAILIVSLCVAISPAYAVSTDVCYDTDAVTMLHADGTDAATTFTDETGHTFTANDNAQIDTAQKVFGTASGLFDGTNDWLTAPDSADWTFGTGDFTMDMRVRFAADEQIISLLRQGGSTSDRWLLFVNDSTDTINFVANETAGIAVSISETWNPVADTWYHVAFVKASNAYYFFIDGTQLGTEDTDTDSLQDIGAGLEVGGRVFDTALELNGWMDEVRIVKGTAIWTDNFTAPSAAYIACGGARRIIMVT